MCYATCLASSKVLFDQLIHVESTLEENEIMNGNRAHPALNSMKASFRVLEFTEFAANAGIIDNTNLNVYISSLNCIISMKYSSVG